MGSDWLIAGEVIAAGAFGGFVYWGSTVLLTRLRLIMRAR